MSKEDRSRWESKYERSAADSDTAPPGESLSWLKPVETPLIALDLACGRGRHSLTLAALGYRVVAVDIARPALTALTALAEAGPSTISPVQADLDCWPFASDAFDLIVQYDFLDRSLFGSMRSTLRPGGLLLIDTFRQSETGADRFGPSNPQFRLRPGELEEEFGDWEIVRSAQRAADDTHASRAAILVRRSR